MRVLKNIIVPVVALSSLSTSVYANIPAYGKSAGTDLTFWKFLYFVFVFGLILAITYYVTHIIAKKSTVKSKSKNMNIVETLPISMDKNVLLIKVGKQYVLLGNTPKNLIYLSTFEMDKLGLNEDDAINNEYEVNFDSYLEDYKGNSSNKFENSINVSLKKLKSMVRGTKFNEKE
jgi:flagellar protein FliO/FliZ